MVKLMMISDNDNDSSRSVVIGGGDNDDGGITCDVVLTATVLLPARLLLTDP